jgi:hypothetical protein
MNLFLFMNLKPKDDSLNNAMKICVVIQFPVCFYMRQQKYVSSELSECSDKSI